MTVDYDSEFWDSNDMPKRSSINANEDELTKLLSNKLSAGGDEPLSEDIRHLLAVAMGRRGGLKGGRARAEKLSAEERSEIAKKAAKARWKDRPAE